MENSEKPSIEIRRLQNEDEAQKCARLMANSEPWITLRRTYDSAVKMLRDPSREVYLATVKNEMVGFIVLIMSGAFVGYIQTVAVMPDWRNKGIGSKLLKFAEDRILNETPNVFILVSSFNEKAQGLYQRLGYEVIGELKDYIVPGHSEILLRKSSAPLSEFRTKK